MKTYLVAIPNWALDTLINWDYRKGKYPHLTKEQSSILNEWLELMDKGIGFICHEPNEYDQPNVPMLPAFGEVCDTTLCYFSILNE